MENLVWRPRAKVVAIIDLVLMGGGAIVLSICFLTVLTIPLEIYAGTAMVLFNAGLVAGALDAIQIWAASKLLNSCDAETTPYNAMVNARHWKTMTIVFLMISIVISVLWVILQSLQRCDYNLLKLLWLVVIVVWRGCALFIVTEFMSEIKHSSDPTLHRIKFTASDPVLAGMATE